MKPTPPDTLHCSEPTLTPDWAWAGAAVDRAVIVAAPRSARKARCMVRSLILVKGGRLYHADCVSGQYDERRHSRNRRLHVARFCSEEVANRLEPVDPVANDLEGRNHWHRQQGAGDAPHPVPEDQGE